MFKNQQAKAKGGGFFFFFLVSLFVVWVKDEGILTVELKQGYFKISFSFEMHGRFVVYYNCMHDAVHSLVSRYCPIPTAFLIYFFNIFWFLSPSYFMPFNLICILSIMIIFKIFIHRND